MVRPMVASTHLLASAIDDTAHMVVAGLRRPRESTSGSILLQEKGQGHACEQGEKGEAREGRRYALLSPGRGSF